jgi:6-pyruvoyltetrahydropterin/6-carboxytetrahydropterin synthase
MPFELTQSFIFEAAHTLERAYGVAASRRIHGHTYHAKVTVGGQPDAVTGMLVDLAVLRAAIERVRDRLDHHFLDEVPGLGPSTLENLCVFVYEHIARDVSGVVRVTVERPGSGDCCTYTPDPPVDTR